MKTGWPKVKLGEVLRCRQELPDMEELLSGRVPIVNKIGFKAGVLEFRGEPKTKTNMILIRPGDLVMSGINAIKGAIAIYPKEANSVAAATIHYSAYEVLSSQADGPFLWWFFRSRFFKNLLVAEMPEGIKSELKPSRLLLLEISLPSLQEQRRIVARIEELATLIKKVQAIREQVVEEREAFLRTVLRHIFKDLDARGTLEDVLVAPPRNGWSAQCDNNDAGTAVLSLSAVTGFHYQPFKFKRTSLPVPQDGHFWLKSGDLLITRSNTPELVGHVAIYDGNPSPCIYPDLMMRLGIREKVVERRFVWYWLQTPMVREYITKNAKGTSPTMKKISQGIVKSIPFPTNVPISEQQRIVKELDSLQSEVDTLKELQDKTVIDLDALMPSILDRAFTGRL